MRDLQLIRSPDDKRRLDLAGVGFIRFENRWGTKLVLTSARGEEWRIEGRPLFTLFRKGPTTAIDAAGTPVAVFSNRGVEHGDRVVEVTTPGRGLLERRPPFILVENGRELASVASRLWDEKPLDLTVLDEEFAENDPLLFLFSLYRANCVSASRSAGAAAGGVTS